MIENRRPVLRAHVRSLPIHLRWVVHMPKRFDESFVAHFFWIKRQLNNFSMPCPICAHFLVRRILRLSSAVSDNCIFHSRNHPELRFHSPKASRRKRRNLTHLSLLRSILSFKLNSSQL